MADSVSPFALTTLSVVTTTASQADGATFTGDHADPPLSALLIKSTFLGLTADASSNSQTALNLERDILLRSTRSLVFSLTAIDQNLRLRI